MAANYYAKHRKKRLMAEINVVPYIDVMLVLLIIFMITAPLLTQGVNIELPQAAAKTIEPKDSEPFVLNVDADGKYYREDNAKEALSPQRVRATAAAVLRNSPKTEFLVRGDRRVEYEAVINAMVLLQQAGVESVGLVTEPPKQKKLKKSRRKK